MHHYLYLLIDGLTILFPFAFSFYPKARFADNWKYAIPAILIPAAIFIAWDIWFTSMGVWGFNPYYVSGFYIANLPIEEVLFFICIPYACLFTYEAVNYFKKVEFDPTRTGSVLVIGLLITGIKHYDRWYPSVTFISLAIMLIFVLLCIRPAFLSRFLFSYMFVLIPFFIVNGILTGTGLPEPVVWYDNRENLGIRMGTIPLEDTFYGMLLLLMNVTIYEVLRKRSSVVSPTLQQS